MMDKFLHLVCCFLATAITIFVIYGYFEEKLWVAQVVGIVVGALLGFGKETYDVWKGGKWDWYDILADCIGIAIPTLFAFGL